MFQILVAEDDCHTARLMQAVLGREGYEVLLARDGREALALTCHQHVDLILLDVMMPVMDGYEVCERLRAGGSTVPILMVTAKGAAEERCRGFVAGTDDYLVKPVNLDELVLRVKALLRRARIAAERRLVVGGVTLDADALTLEREGVVQTLPKKEFLLLYKLLSNPGHIYTRLQLMDEIWGRDSESGDTTVNVHVSRLRKRCEGFDEFEIVAVRGVGYKAVTHV